jgi:hypothetical protein
MLFAQAYDKFKTRVLRMVYNHDTGWSLPACDLFGQRPDWCQHQGSILPHSGTRRGFRPESERLSVTLSAGTPLCSYGIAYRGVYGLSTCGLFKKSLRSPRCVGWGLSALPRDPKFCKPETSGDHGIGETVPLAPPACNAQSAVTGSGSVVSFPCCSFLESATELLKPWHI